MDLLLVVLAIIAAGTIIERERRAIDRLQRLRADERRRNHGPDRGQSL